MQSPHRMRVISPARVSPPSSSMGYRVGSPWKQRVVPTASSRDGYTSPTPRHGLLPEGRVQAAVSPQRGQRSHVPSALSPSRSTARPGRRQYLDAVSTTSRRGDRSPSRKAPTSMHAPMLVPPVSSLTSQLPQPQPHQQPMTTMSPAQTLQPTHVSMASSPEVGAGSASEIAECLAHKQSQCNSYQRMSQSVEVPEPEPSEEEDEIEGETEELAAGVIFSIGSSRFQITSPLGMGSFGVVWAASCDGVGEVAVKEIICQSQVDLSRAIYEAELLQTLSSAEAMKKVGPPATPGFASSAEAAGPHCCATGLRIPAYVASETTKLSPDVRRMRLAMARIAGEPLDRFLRNWQRETVDATQNRRSQPPLEQVAEACRYAKALVTQLAPTMERISKLAYHRDVNAHNILVTQDDGPQFGLVDFGLAVNASRWQGGPAPKSASNAQGWLPGCAEWQHLDVGGDCRYWPTSAWLQFQVGCYELAEAKSLCLEYQTHLDLQGLGITALQVLAEMMPVPPFDQTENLDVDDIANINSEGVPIEFWKLLVAWEQYWAASTHFWTALLDTFRNNGDWNVLKNEFIAMNVHDIISRKLRAVRNAIIEAREACRRAPASCGLLDAPGLFSALLVMISSGEERDGPTSWDEVCGCLVRSVSTAARSRSRAPHDGHRHLLHRTEQQGSVRSHQPPSPRESSQSRVMRQSSPAASSRQLQQPVKSLPPRQKGVREEATTGSACRTSSLVPDASPHTRQHAAQRSPSPDSQPNMVLLPPPKQVSSKVPSPHTSRPSASEPEAEKLAELAADLRTTAAQIRGADGSASLSDRRKHRISDTSSTIPRDESSNRSREEPRALKPKALSKDKDGNAQPHELFVKLNILANKVVQLAHAMEKLELQDRNMATTSRVSDARGAPIVTTGYS